MIAYYFTGKRNGQKVHELHITAQAGSLANAQRVIVQSKREASLYCKAHNITPYNF